MLLYFSVTHGYINDQSSLGLLCDATRNRRLPLPPKRSLNPKMKLLLVLSVIVAFVASAPSEEVDLLYAIDFDAIYANEAEKKATFDCILDKAPCGDKQIFKDSVIKVISNKCADCNADQKKKYDQVLKKFHDENESIYNEFMKKLEAKN